MADMQKWLDKYDISVKRSYNGPHDINYIYHYPYYTDPSSNKCFNVKMHIDGDELWIFEKGLMYSVYTQGFTIHGAIDTLCEKIRGKTLKCFDSNRTFDVPDDLQFNPVVPEYSKPPDNTDNLIAVMINTAKEENWSWDAIDPDTLKAWMDAYAKPIKKQSSKMSTMARYLLNK